MERPSGTVSDVFQGTRGEALDSHVSDIHLEETAVAMRKWEPCCPYLGLSEAEEEKIRRDFRDRYCLQKRQALRMWKEKMGYRATYRELITVFQKAQQMEVAEKVGTLLDSPPTDICTLYRTFLEDCYRQQPSPSSSQWPKLMQSTYIDPILLEVPPTHTQHPSVRQPGKRSGIPVELESLLSGKVAQRRMREDGTFVLIEGVAGAGKTMLTWHASRMWAEGHIFQELQLLIYVSLRDSAFQSAKYLADLIPHPSSQIRKDVANAMAQQNGKNVCFLLDGWDEVPPSIREKSFLRDFISRAPQAALPQCHIVMTSRPIASASITPYVTKRVEIQGFKEEQLKEYISKHTTGSTEAKYKLTKSVTVNPQLMLLCMLPLMAAILVFLFSFTGEVLPLKIHTEMFKLLVLNLLLRHMQLRTHYRLKPFREFTDLPPDLLENIKRVSRVAFYGVINNKAVFDFDDLQSLGILSEIDTLGLMQANEQLEWFGPTKDYSFLHHHIQTFLAGYHISQLPHEEHARTLRMVLQKHPLSSALTVYAGLTRLDNKKALDVLLEVSKMPLDFVSVVTSMAQSPDVGSDRRRLLLALLRCIYEAQSPQLFLLVKPPLNPLFASDTDWVTFTFVGLSLTPTDCHVIAYYVSAIIPYINIDVNLSLCSIKDEGVKAMMGMLHCTIHATRSVHLHLPFNHMTHLGVHSIAKTLTTTSVITALNLGWNWHPESTDIKLALKYLIEGLSRNSSCKVLDIEHNSLTEKHVHYLVLLFALCVSINELNLDGTKPDTSISLIATAMNKSSVTHLHLVGCYITNQQLLQLGKALQANTSLLRLDLTLNPFTPAGFADFLRCLMPQPPALGPPLMEIFVEFQLSDEHKQLVEEINQRRRISATMLSHHHGTIFRAHRLAVKHVIDQAH